MKKSGILFCILACVFAHADAKIIFGSKHSMIKISDTGIFHLSQNIIDADGTFLKDSTGVITAEAGKTIHFSRGILESNGTEMNLTGTFDPNVSGEEVYLGGNASLRAEPGKIIENVRVENGENIITGQPLFQNPIVLTDANTTLSIAIHAKLNQNIELGGGTLILEHDLELADGINITGAGTIRLNNRTLASGSKELTHSDAIHWIDADAYYINGTINLATPWFYLGTNTINGNGNVLDLRSRGTIFVEDNTTLYLTDMFIKGLGLGGIVLAGEHSKVILSNVDIELETDYSTTIGNFYVDGPGTFLLGEHNWLFDNGGTLSVDGVVLWTDRMDTPTIDRGFILFEPGNHSFIDSGTIREKVCLSDIESLESILEEHAEDIESNSNAIVNNYNNIVNNSNAIVNNYTNIVNNSYAIVNNHSNIINNSNAIINTYELAVDNSNVITSGTLGGGGGGAAPFMWAGTFSTSQWICDSGHLDPCMQMIITGDDITLSGSGSVIVFSNPDGPQFIVQPGICVTLKDLNLQNVNAQTFQFGACSCVKFENVTLGLTDDVVLEGANFEVVDGTLTVYGIGGIRKLTIGSAAPMECGSCHPKTREDRRIFPDSRSFILGNNTLAIKNIELIGLDEINDDAQKTIALQGTTFVDIGQDSNHSFVATGADNTIRLLTTNLTLDGLIMFGNEAHNVLHLVHKIPGGLTSQPRVTFGDGLLYVTSELGVAELVFDDDVVEVVNAGFNSFVLGENSFLGGRQVTISSHPIRVISTQTDNDDDLVLTSALTSPTEVASGFYVAPAGTGTPMGTIPPSGFTPGLIGYLLNGEPRPLLLRSIFDTKQATHIKEQVTLRDAAGDVHLEKTTATNVTVHPTDKLILTIKDGTTLHLAPTDVMLKPDDIIFVSGKDNVIHITKSLTLDGSLLFEDGAHLTFEIDEQEIAHALRLPEGIAINPDAPIEVRRK